MVNVQYIVSFEDNNLLDDIFDFREEAIDWAESHIDYRPTVEAAEVEYDDYGGVTVGDSEVIYSYKDLESEPVDESCKKSLKESEVDQVLAQFEAELNSETNESWHEAKFDFENDTEIDPPSDDVKPAKFDFDKDEDVTDFEDGVFFDANGNRVDVDNYKLHEAAEEEIPEEDPEDEVEDSEDDEPHVTKVPDTDFLVNDVEVEEENPEESEDEEDDEVDVNDIDGVVISIFDTDFDVDPVAFEKRDTAEDYLEAPVDFLKELADALGIGDQVEINAVEEDEIPEVSDDEEESKIEDKEVSSELVKDFDSDEEEDDSDKDEDEIEEVSDEEDSSEDEEDEEFPNPEKNHLVDTYKDVDIYDCTCGKFVAMIDGKKVKKASVDELKKCIDGECEELDEYYEPCCAIKDETELKGMDNAVVDCQTDYKIIAHSEDEKPLDCKMKKAPLEKPLTEEDMSDEEFLEAFGKAMVERHNCKLSEDDEKKTLKK